MFSRWNIAGFNVENHSKHGRNIEITKTIINVYGVRCKIDASLILLMTNSMNHQSYQCVVADSKV